MTREESLTNQVTDAGPEALSIFREILSNGETHEFAAMCALRQAPGTRFTSRAYEQGMRETLGCGSDVTRKAMVALARKAGIKTQGKFYNGTGGYTEASSWSSDMDDTLTAAKQKNLTLTGAIQHQGRKPEAAPKRTALAPDIVNRFMVEECQRDPALAEKVQKNPKAKRELREKIVEKHGARKR